MKIFNNIQRIKSIEVLNNNKYKPMNSLKNFEIIDLAIEWSYYSGKIEGNTYDFVETETLLKDGVTSYKRYDDAVMLKNLYNTFISYTEEILKGNQVEIDQKLICSVHSFITKDLLAFDERGVYRDSAVKITGTNYTPVESKIEIEHRIQEILNGQKEISNPLEKAIYLHCNLAKLQPFVDGNKRTARMIESIVLMKHNIVPLVAIQGEEIQKYRSSIIKFYESGDYSSYVQFFLEKKQKQQSIFIPKSKKKGIRL